MPEPISDLLAGPLGYLPALLALVALVQFEVVRERRLHAPPAGRRMDLRALGVLAAVVLAVLTLGLRMVDLTS